MSDMKIGRFEITPGGPAKLVEDPRQEISELTEVQQLLLEQVGLTFRAYMNASLELLQDKYAHIRDLVPRHLSDPGNVITVACQDGIVVRFEANAGERRVITGWTNASLAEIAAGLSENLIHCYADKSQVPVILTNSPEIRLSTTDIDQVRREVLNVKVGFNAIIKRPLELPKPPGKPFCLLSVRNSFEVGLLGVMMDTDTNSFEQGQEFITRTNFRFPFGWECVEIYPFVDPQHWKQEYAPLWAENDLLASVVARQFRESQFQQLDPNAAARREFASLLQRCQELLDSNPKEEVLQKFLGKNPSLLCPTQIKVWPKLELGRHVTDFVFREATGDYLMVELERSTHRLFLKNGDPSSKLNHALSQILDWKRYIEDNLATVERELGLSGISSSPKCLVVIGRSEGLTDENRRKLQVLENSSHKLKVMTYDDMYGDAKAVAENLLGPLRDPGGTTQIYYPPKGTVALPTSNKEQPARATQSRRESGTE